MLPGDQMRHILTARVVGTDIKWPVTEYMLRRALHDAEKLRAEVTTRDDRTTIVYRDGIRVDYEPIEGGE
jgi:hypothetical protein